MSSDLGSELDKAYQELRGIESEIAVLSGRNQQDRTRRRIVVDSVDSSFDNLHSGNDRRVFETGNSRRIVVTTSNLNVGNGFSRKRTRYELDEDDDVVDNSNIKNVYQPPQKRTLQSSVVMPTIETKSRAEILTELKKSEKKEDVVRNRRLFSSLIVGTLNKFQKEENTVKNKVQAQAEKQREIERRLELTEQENRDRINKEKEKLLERRRQKELEIQRLKRERAIVKYAEEKEQHFRRLQCFIQTQTKPPIFFLPAKHTLRTLELLKDSAKKVEGLILLRREEMKRELQRDCATIDKTFDEEFQEEDENASIGLRSAVVAVVKNEKTDEKKVEVTADTEISNSDFNGKSLKNANTKQSEVNVKVQKLTEKENENCSDSSNDKVQKSEQQSKSISDNSEKGSSSNSESENSDSDDDSSSCDDQEVNEKVSVNSRSNNSSICSNDNDEKSDANDSGKTKENV